MRDEGREELNLREQGLGAWTSGSGGEGAGGLDPWVWGRRVWGPGPLGLGAEGLGEEDWGPRELCLLVAVGESSVTLLQVPRLRSACLCPPWWR